MRILICDAVEWGAEHKILDFPNDVGKWVIEAFHGSDIDFVNWKVQRDIPIPGGTFDGIVVGGSPASANDRKDWISYLVKLIRQWADRQIPLLGICFGHQLIAHALGGRVQKNPQGWEVGYCAIDLTPEGRDDPFFATLSSPLNVMQTHRDIVTALPPEAVCLASSSLCPIQSFRIGSRIRTAQFHPEYTVDRMRFVMTPRREMLEAAGVNVENKLAELKETAESRTVLSNFLNYIVA